MNIANGLPTSELVAFITKREHERDWLFANGFNNGDPNTNGEFDLIATAIKRCDSFIDVGYNNGEHSLHAEQINPKIKILGFEPNHGLHAKSPKHTLIRSALSDESGEKTFFVHQDDLHSGVSSLFARQDMNPSFRSNFLEKTTTVQKLDDLVPSMTTVDLSTTTFLKIDTEGAEAKVLRGAENILTSSNTVGYFEYSPAWLLGRETLKSTFYFLDALQYGLYRITPFGLEHIRFFHPSLENYRYQNIFFAKNAFMERTFQHLDLPFEFSQTKLFLFAKSDN